MRKKVLLRSVAAVLGVVALVGGATLVRWFMSERDPHEEARQKAAAGRIDWEASISEEDQAWLQTVASAAPDAFSEDLDQVMAVLEPRARKSVVIFYPSQYQREIVARAWAINAETMTGDPRELEPLLEHLERTVELNEWGDYIPESPDQDTRAAALYGLARAVASGRYKELHPRIERVAVEHARAPVFRMNATIILMLLGEHGGRSPTGEEAFVEAMRDAAIAERLVPSVRNVYTEAGFEIPE